MNTGVSMDPDDYTRGWLAALGAHEPLIEHLQNELAEARSVANHETQRRIEAEADRVEAEFVLAETHKALRGVA